MTTPEHAVKDRVKRRLNEYGPELKHFWCVQNGMGSPALDCIGCYRGLHFEIETKAPGKVLTPRQEQTKLGTERSGAPVFIIGDDAGLARLTLWLDAVRVIDMRALLGLRPDK